MQIETFLSQLLARIERSPFSIAAVCRKAQIDPGLISRWKSGKVEPRLSSIARMNNSLDALLREVNQ